MATRNASSAAGRRTLALRRALGPALPDRPFAVAFWDGGTLPATREPVATFAVRSSAAIAHLLRAPGQLGLVRAYVSGGLDVDDLDAVMELLDTWKPPTIGPVERVRLGLAAARAAGVQAPATPQVELRPRGPRHSPARDARAVRHHYDVSNDFFALFLDASMTYSCGIFSEGARTLEEAQAAKRALICTKLRLGQDDRVLDVGCGWGSFAVQAATEHGAQVTGITLSAPQAEVARARAEAAGVADRVDIRVADYRDLAGERFDAIASIGMVEHVGEPRADEYALRLAALLRPGGRLLNHGIARLRHTRAAPGPFSERYVFPDAVPLHLSRVLLALERAGFETHHVEGFAPDYAETLRHWAERLDARRDEAERLAGAERVRVWRLYLRAARNGFQNGFTSIYQVRSSLRS
ncbi:MAG: Cyclopropane-fatty-acyl-phospholipid synthase [uncultured Solirubrobacteraceae bacterium]|uniref:Cyclopropane-fatty-acyl-phospholipid synthase n=1 Tax=uncultured Solirubrobacteraceae bacterium TaxID=1162706 RepID=A0A6J4RNB1_9ACTN|nr:MAG: Cyclopropane-fatty-acyl-phospholipid synthase [uncultured Solirubrobacteraceae bacterium]